MMSNLIKYLKLHEQVTLHYLTPANERKRVDPTVKLFMSQKDNKVTEVDLDNKLLLSLNK